AVRAQSDCGAPGALARVLGFVQQRRLEQRIGNHPLKPASEVRRILDKLETQHPDADTELHYTTPYELLVATILSAQSADALLTWWTPALLKRYPAARPPARATTEELEPQIHATGFFRAKSKSLI